MLRSIVLALLLVCVCGQQIPWLAFNGGGSRTGINSNETIITVGTVGSLKQQWMFNLTQNASDPMYDVLVCLSFTRSNTLTERFTQSFS